MVVSPGSSNANTCDTKADDDDDAAEDAALEVEKTDDVELLAEFVAVDDSEPPPQAISIDSPQVNTSTCTIFLAVTSASIHIISTQSNSRPDCRRDRILVMNGFGHMNAAIIERGSAEANEAHAQYSCDRPQQANGIVIEHGATKARGVSRVDGFGLIVGFVGQEDAVTQCQECAVVA